MVNYNFGLVNQHGETYIEESREEPNDEAALAHARAWASSHANAAAVWVEAIGRGRIGTVVNTPA